ncbi:MAG: hypothetical protein ABFC62_06890 [Clostridiaceae bacterium]|nr:hypothetical protein [Eubacteriales bacterium]
MPDEHADGTGGMDFKKAENSEAASAKMAEKRFFFMGFPIGQYRGNACAETAFACGFADITDMADDRHHPYPYIRACGFS